jgi:hypothetical protein
VNARRVLIDAAPLVSERSIVSSYIAEMPLMPAVYVNPGGGVERYGAGCEILRRADNDHQVRLTIELHVSGMPEESFVPSRRTPGAPPASRHPYWCR